jgi:hypothetical protein
VASHFIGISVIINLGAREEKEFEHVGNSCNKLQVGYVRRAFKYIYMLLEMILNKSTADEILISICKE